VTTDHGNEDGFTLVETLVAFTILSAAIIVSFQIFNSGLRQHAMVTERKAIMEIARAELDKLALEPVLEAGTVSGHSDKGDWQIEMRELKEQNGLSSDANLHSFYVAFRLLDNGAADSNPIILDTILLARRKFP
jgi:type II secretory pathway component PulJ